MRRRTTIAFTRSPCKSPHTRHARAEALIINPPKTARSMWVFARKAMFCKGSDASGLNGVGGFMIKAARDYKDQSRYFCICDSENHC